MEIVLYQPLIPQNTGNIARTCLVLGATLTLVRPLGFQINDKSLKRAGMDYWQELEWKVIDNLEEYLSETSKDFYFFSSKGKVPSTEAKFSNEDVLIFGNEQFGLPKTFHDQWAEKFLRIPMKPARRCLNLSNAVAIALFEATRQNAFSTFS